MQKSYFTDYNIKSRINLQIIFIRNFSNINNCYIFITTTKWFAQYFPKGKTARDSQWGGSWEKCLNIDVRHKLFSHILPTKIILFTVCVLISLNSVDTLPWYTKT